MSTGEDESSPGLNGRLRPRKSTLSTPSPHKSTRKSEAKHAEDRLKKTSTTSKASPNKQDDLTAKSDTSPTSLFLCPYCDRKFTSKQTASKHARRIHLFTSKQDNFIKCLYCNHTEAESNLIIKHMVDNHPNQYFACLDCYTRFSATTELAEHKLNVCEKQKPSYRSKLRQKPSGTRKNAKRSNKQDKDDIQNENTECSDEHRFNGMVISCELKPSQTHDAADIEDNLTTNLILPPSKALCKSGMDKNAVIVLDDIQWNKRIPPNFSFHNTDADQILSRLGVVHRSPRVGESTKKEWIKIVDETTQKFERCFDTNFYSKVAKNVQENLTHFLDGSFNFNPNKENTIKTRKAKTSVVINTAEGFPILLAYEQYSRNLFDGYMPRALAPKHKWKWDSTETDKIVVTPIVDSKRDSHVNNCIITLVSSLDIWTQLQMRRKFEDIFKVTPTAKKTEKQNIIGRELKEILESRDIPSNSIQVVKSQRSSVTATRGLEPPAYLGLKPAMPSCELKPAVLSGEWVRPRCYVCCACGEQTNDARSLSSHISTQHPNAQVQHYEIVGETLLSADILKHLYVPPSQMSNRTRPPRGFRDCTKCKKSITLEDLHQHMLDCAGDTPAVRRKCRYRPFGVRRRRPRLPDNTLRKKMRKDIRSRHRQKCHLRARPRIRTEVGDAETIRKMIADLPAKRNRVNLPIARPRRNIITAKKTIKLRSSDDIKSAKVRSVKKITRLKKSVASKKHPEIDTLPVDEDDQPLKLSSKRGNKSIVGISPNRGINKANDYDSKDGVDDLSENQECLHTEILMQSEHQKVDVYGAGPSNVRQHSNRNNSNNQDNSDRRPTGEKNNGNEENNITPAPNIPFKQSVGSSTSKAESIEHNTLPCDSIYVTGQDSNPGPRMISEDQQTFENENVTEKFDKPPLCRDLSENGNLSKDKSKSSRNKKGLEHCIAMLRTKKGIPDSYKGNKPSNPDLRVGHDSNISLEENKEKPIGHSTSSVSLEHNNVDSAYSDAVTAEQASSKTHFDTKTQTMYRNDIHLSPGDVYRRKSSVDSRYMIMKTHNESSGANLSPRRLSLNQNDVMSSKPIELTSWVPVLPIASDTYADLNLMRRNSYDANFTSGHSLYQNTINAASAMNVPDMQYIMGNHPHMTRNVDGHMPWHHQTLYRDIYNQLMRGGVAADCRLPAQYATVHHGHMDASVAPPTPKKRRDSHRKESVQEQQQQRDRKRKISPRRQNSVSAQCHDVGKQIRTSPEGFNMLRASDPIQAPPPTTRVRRDSHKRGVDKSESEMNFTLNAEDLLSTKMLRKSPRPYYPDHTTSLFNLRRHSMDISAATNANKTNYDVNITRQSPSNDIYHLSPLSRGRSESRATTPDSTRLYYEDRNRELNNDMHSRNMSNLTSMRHDIYEDPDSRYNAMKHEKQLQDALALSFQTSVLKSNVDNSLEKDLDIQQNLLSLQEQQHKHKTRKISEDQIALASNIYQANFSSLTNDNKNVKNILPPQNISFENLPKSLEITAQIQSTGAHSIHSPPDYRAKPQTKTPYESEYHTKRYSENQGSSFAASPLIRRSETVYSTSSPTDLTLSNDAMSEIPLDLSRKDHNLTDVSSKVLDEQSKTYPDLPINLENHNIQSRASLQIIDSKILDSSTNLDTKEGIMHDDHRSSIDSINSLQSFNEVRLCNEPNRQEKINETSASLHFTTAEALSDPSISRTSESRNNKFMVSDNTPTSVLTTEIDCHSKDLVYQQITENSDTKRYPLYDPVDLNCHDQNNKPSRTTDNFVSEPQDFEDNDICQQMHVENIISGKTPHNLITATVDNTIVNIESDDEENDAQTQQKYEGVSKSNISNEVPVKTGETNLQMNVDTKSFTGHNKGLDPETFANLEELVVNNEARRNDVNDTDKTLPNANTGSLKTIHQYIANVLEQMNEAQIKRMLGISPTLMAKIKAATVNEAIPSSPTPENKTTNENIISVAACPSSVIPKKRSPAQPFVRLSSSELCSISPELGSSNMPNDLQTSKGVPSNNDIDTHISSYLDSSKQLVEQTCESKLDKLDNDLDDNEINVVDVLESDPLPINKNLMVAGNTFLSTFASQDLSTKAIKPKNNEQTASLRAVRIKTPSSRKSGSDEKIAVTASTKSSHDITNDDDKIMRVHQSISPLVLPKPILDFKYDQPDSTARVNCDVTQIQDQQKDANSIILSQRVLTTVEQTDKTKVNDDTFEGITPFPNSDLNEENVLIQPQHDFREVSSAFSEVVYEGDMNWVHTAKGIQTHTTTLQSDLQLNAPFLMEPNKDNKDHNVFSKPVEPTNFLGDENNDKSKVNFTKDGEGVFQNKEKTERTKEQEADSTFEREQNFINPVNILVQSHSSPRSLSPKSKKSDADDSEDDVSLADILKKRNNANLNNDVGVIDCDEEKIEQELDSTKNVTHPANIDKGSNSTGQQSNGSEIENMSSTSYSFFENMLINDIHKRQMPSYDSEKSNCASNFDMNVIKDYEHSSSHYQNFECYEKHNQINHSNNKEYDYVPEKSMSPNLELDKLDCFKHKDNLKLSTENEEVKEAILNANQHNITNTNVCYEIKSIIDAESRHESNPIISRQEQAMVDIGDLTPDCPKVIDVSTTNESSQAIVKELCSEVIDRNQMPLRRSKRGKSIYVNSSHVDDCDQGMLPADNDESKKVPLTMKRLILSRVQKDITDETVTSADPSISEIDGVELVNTDHLEQSSSKKVKAIKRKKSHSKRKTKKSKSSHKLRNEDSSDYSHSEKEIILREFLHENKIEDNESSIEEPKLPITPENTSDTLEHSSQITVEDIQEQDSSVVCPAPQIGKRKKNKSLLSKSKKAKYSKTKSNSDFDTEDEKELTEIKQRKEEEDKTMNMEKMSSSKNISEIKDDACKIKSYRNHDIDIKAAVNVNVVSETRTTCYSRPVSNKRSVSSFDSKKETVNYDPYDIDFDEMIQSTGPVLKRKSKSHAKTSQESIGRQSKKVHVHIKTTKVNEKALPVVNHDSDSDSSKSDIPLQKYVDEKACDQRNKNNNNKSSNINLVEKHDDILQDKNGFLICDKYGDECSTSSSNTTNDHLTCKDDKSTRSGDKKDIAPEIAVVNLNQNLGGKDKIGPTPKSSKDKYSRRTLALCDVVDVSTNEELQEQSDKFMANFGFFSERMPRKSNLLASKKIAETFNSTSKDIDESHLNHRRKSRKSSQTERKYVETSEHNVSEGASSASAGNYIIDCVSHHLSDDNNLARDDQIDLNTKSDLSDKINNLPSQSCIEDFPSSPKEAEANETDIDDVPSPVTPEISKEIIPDKSDPDTESEPPKKNARNKQTDPSKQADVEEYICKPKMYPDISEIDLLEDKFDKIKRKRRSLAVAAKQIQVIAEASSSKKSRKPDKKKSGKNRKKKRQNSQVPTKGALKGFESIKISIPTHELTMPSVVSPPRQQKRKKKGNKRRKGVSESGSSCSEYDDKGKVSQDKDIYEFKDCEDAELLELRPSTVMDRFRSIHKTNKVKNKDKSKDKEKIKDKSKKTDSKEKRSSKEERSKAKAHGTKKGVGKEYYKVHESEITREEGNSSESLLTSGKEKVPSDKYSKNMSRKRLAGNNSGQNENLESAQNESRATQVGKFNHDDDDAVPSTSGLVPEKDDESDYESESSIAGGCIVYKSDEFNCLCQSDIDSEESDTERACGKSHCIYRNRNADKNTAIGNIFKNNAVRREKPETKVVEAAKPDLDQLFDSLLESKSDELARNENKMELDTNDLFPEIDNFLEEQANKMSLTSLAAENETLDTLDLPLESPQTDNNIPFMTSEDAYPISKDSVESSNLTTKSGVYNMVSTKSTQTGATAADDETETASYKNRLESPDDDEFDIDEKESDEWMVFQELICPVSKSSQTEPISSLDLNSPGDICVMISTRGSQTVLKKEQIDDVDVESVKNVKWKLMKMNIDVMRVENSSQTDLKNFKYLDDDGPNDSDDNALSERDSPSIEPVGEENTKICSGLDGANNERVASLPEGATCSTATSSTAELHSPSRKSDEGISTSHDCSADAFDQSVPGAGVARQRARRKCTVGKQNVLVEHWSSESEVDGVPPRRNSADSVAPTVSRKKRGKKKEHSGSSKKGKHASKKDRKHAVRRRASSEDSEVGRSRRPPGPKIRAWTRHHYWSSEAEEDPQPQHGWIVGDSHKKLVTMLAHAKGRKRSSEHKRQLDE